MIRDTLLVFRHELRRSLRSPVWVVFGIVQPILWLVLFSPLVPDVPLATFVPGLLVMIIVFSALNVGYELVASSRAGVVERLAATPASRSGLMFGRVLRDGLATGAQAIILLGIAFAMGLRSPVGGVALALLLAGLTGLSGAAVSYSLALLIRDEGGLSALTGFLGMPLLLLSGAIVPLGVGPDWLRAVGHANPFYYVAEGGRDLFAGRYGSPTVGIAFAIALTLAVLTLAWATRSMRRAAG